MRYVFRIPLEIDGIKLRHMFMVIPETGPEDAYAQYIVFDTINAACEYLTNISGVMHLPATESQIESVTARLDRPNIVGCKE